ncbi:hypothetical protein KZZ52_54200 [Dactylosporangium sp. AC04546]|uniref:hypothetical protein n=1 Tax=Dactylosporangium sp. AC04546 TaxID=2862460 RepID=UPI001EDDD508|nr:hypothetical protein [Dactylosporangium sp. AC04546]WVK82806.1 hypothetical protein KZZ52_54200 [Dactylosporangium sp. AC04546]
MAEPSGLFRSADELDDEEREEAPRSALPIKRIAIVCAALAGVALLVSGIVFGPTVFRVLQQSDTELRSPDQIGTFTLDKSDDARSTAEYVRDAIASEVNLDASVGLIYKDQANSIILVAGTARVWKPEESLKDAFAVMADDSGGVRDLRDVPTGDLGGIMRCGVTTTQDGDLPVCGWADNGSVGVALLPGRQPADAAKAFLDLRQAVEHRS